MDAESNDDEVKKTDLHDAGEVNQSGLKLIPETY